MKLIQRHYIPILLFLVFSQTEPFCNAFWIQNQPAMNVFRIKSESFRKIAEYYSFMAFLYMYTHQFQSPKPTKFNLMWNSVESLTGRMQSYKLWELRDHVHRAVYNSTSQSRPVKNILWFTESLNSFLCQKKKSSLSVSTPVLFVLTEKYIVVF